MTSDPELGDAAPLERMRAWQREGDSYVALSAEKGYAVLRRAADAYRSAEALLDEIEVGVIERLCLYAAHGRALLQLADNSDVDLASAAATRLADALSLARKHFPEGVVDIKLDLCRAEHVIALRCGRPAPRDHFDETYA